MINPDQEKKKMREKNIFDSVNALYEGCELTLNTFNSGIFPIKEIKGEGLKTLTPK